MKYEYKFVRVEKQSGIKNKSSDGWENEAKKVIKDEGLQGWRLVQVVLVPLEKSGVNALNYYELIFEKTISD